jgi:plasmid stability protein
MASLTIKDIPEDLHGHLKREAEASFHSLNQEVLARLERTFEIDAALHTKRDQKWIDEALASGPATPLTRREMEAIRSRVLTGKPA